MSKFATTIKRTEKGSIRHREYSPGRLPWPPIWDPIGKTLDRDPSSEFEQPYLCIKTPSLTKQEARLVGVARGWFIGRSTRWPKRDWPICAHDRPKEDARMGLHVFLRVRLSDFLMANRGQVSEQVRVDT